MWRVRYLLWAKHNYKCGNVKLRASRTQCRDEANLKSFYFLLSFYTQIANLWTSLVGNYVSRDIRVVYWIRVLTFDVETASQRHAILKDVKPDTANERQCLFGSTAFVLEFLISQIRTCLENVVSVYILFEWDRWMKFRLKLGPGLNTILILGHIEIWRAFSFYFKVTFGKFSTSYKGTELYTILKVLKNVVLWQDAVIDWARDHRMHHKYSETDADPHNATRGFFFAHVGWLLVRKHPQIKVKGHTIDLSDLKSDPILRFQKK